MLYRGNSTGQQLLAKIRDTKNAVGSRFKVGTADSWNIFKDGTADLLIKEARCFALQRVFILAGIDAGEFFGELS